MEPIRKESKVETSAMLSKTKYYCSPQISSSRNFPGYPPQISSSETASEIILRNYPQKLFSEIIFRNYPQKFPQKLSSQTPSDILLRNFKHIALVRILLALSNVFKSCSKLASIVVLDLLS